MYKIVNTTDGKFVGREFEYEISKTENLIFGDYRISIEKLLILKDGKIRLINSSYVIDAEYI